MEVTSMDKSKRPRKHRLYFDDELREQESAHTEAVANKFQKDSRGTSQHVIQDSHKKFLKLEGDNTVVAKHLDGGNAPLAMKINVDTYSENVFNVMKRPVILGVNGCNLYFCCTEGARNPEICLMDVSIKEKEMKEELLPFIFYCQESEISSLLTFESAALPGYYLSTSQDETEKMQIRPKNDQVVLMDFALSPDFP